ncbi:MAG: hypothetical protein V8Q67_10265 [Blautia massiliensis (ex Durand et al. 2017)]
MYNRKTVAGFPYEIYYFSRNMEHVLHDRAENLTDDEKEDLAFDIADQYTDQLEKFLENIYMTMVFMYVVLIKIPGNLSWMEIIH